MDRDTLETLLKSKYGEDFDTSLITDDDIATLSPIDDHIDESTDPDDDQDDEPIDNNSDVSDEDIEIDLESINVDELSEDAKLLYKAMVKEKKERLNDKIVNLISSSNLSETQKKVVKDFSKVSNNIEQIKTMIADLEKDNKASKRVIGNSRVIGKNNVKSTVKIDKKDKAPALGTKEFGAWLARKK